MSIDRSLQTLLLAGMLILGIAVFRYLTDTGGMAEAVFWGHKYLQPAGAYDIVLVGDSRVNRGVSPAAMKAALPAKRIVNYAFTSIALTPEYLTAAAELLDRHGTPALVIGVTPYAFTARAAEKNGYTVFQHRRRQDVALEVTNGRAVTAFSSLIQTRRDTAGIFRRYTLKNYPDGWTAIEAEPLQPAALVNDYGLNFYRNTVDSARVTALLKLVRMLTHQGITCYGFFPPVSREIAAVEAHSSGFIPAAFIAAFQQAGGRWIDVGNGYASYDGSHLAVHEAQHLSLKLAEAIAQK
jgi:hypothetical protein